MPEASKRGKRAHGAQSPARGIESEATDVRVAALTPIPQLLREMDCDPARVLASVGLDLSLFDDPEHRVSFVKAGALLQACAAASDIPHFGLLVENASSCRCSGSWGNCCAAAITCTPPCNSWCGTYTSTIVAPSDTWWI